MPVEDVLFACVVCFYLSHLPLSCVDGTWFLTYPFAIKDAVLTDWLFQRVSIAKTSRQPRKEALKPY